MHTRWTAEELRALGVDLPEYVPDHATISRDKVWFLPLSTDDSDIGVVFLEAITWEETHTEPLGEA